MSHIVKTIAVLTARPGKAEALAALLHGMAPFCRAEPGNLEWSVWRDASNPARFVLDEVYTDSVAVAAHHETPHYKEYSSKIPELGDRMIFALTPD